MQKKVYTASRLSWNNTLFPPQIIMEENGLYVRCPGLFSGTKTYIPYENISCINTETPLVGYSTISFFAQGTEIVIHGFLAREAKAIKHRIVIAKNK